MSNTNNEIAEAIKLQARESKVTEKFLGLMGFGQPKTAGQTLTGIFDSIVANATQAKTSLSAVIPVSLLELKEALDPASFGYILDSIETGVNSYRAINGNAMPSGSLVASALCAGSVIQSKLKTSESGGLYDSSNGAFGGSDVQGFYDSVSASGHSHTAEVPSLAMVTIAQTIANALPIVSYLPNIKGTNTVPLVYVRQVAGISYGKTKKGDYLDGVNASNQYFDNAHTFEATPSQDRKTWTVTAKRSTEEGAGFLPVVLGASVICVDGLYFAHDTTSQSLGGSTSGTHPLYAHNTQGIKIKGTLVKLASGSEVALGTSEYTIKFDVAIPAGAKVTVTCVANFEAKNSEGKYILQAPNADIKNEYDYISARPIRGTQTATIDAMTQMQNELGLDPRATFVAVMINKLMFEQNIRLLTDATKIAKGLGFHRQVDLSRGSDLTQAYNKTSDMASELIPAVEDAKRRIIAETNHTPSGFDIYVTGTLTTVARSMADDTNFVPTTLPVGVPNSITRIGSRGSDNYYYVPESSGVLDNGEITIVTGVGTDDDDQPVNITEKVSYGDVLIVARNEIASKSMFIGHIAVPVVTEDVRENKFESGVAVYTRQACQLNRNSRYGRQVQLLRVINLPKVLSSELSQIA